MTGLVFAQTGGLDASAGREDSPAQEPSSTTPAAPATGIVPSADTPEAQAAPIGAPADPDVEPTGVSIDEAELIARLERILRTNREELAKQEALLDEGPDSDYGRAEREFNELDRRHRGLRQAYQEAEEEGQEDRAAELGAELEDAARIRELARVRFELEVRERKAVAEQVEILKQAIAADEARLRELLGEEPGPADPAEPGTSAETPTASAEAPAPEESPTPAEPASAPQSLLPVERVLPEAHPAADDPAPPRPAEREEVTQAQREVETRADAAEQAERRSRSLDERLDLVDRKLETIRDQLGTAQGKSDNARETRDVLVEEFRSKSLSGASPDELRPLRDRIQEAEQAVRQATAEVRDRTARLQEVHDERDLIVEAREAVIREAAEARLALELAQATLRETINPFSPRNLTRWVVERGPGLLVILLGSLFLVWLINRFGSRIASMMARRSTRGSQAEREDRAKTLVSVFENASFAVIFVGAGLMALDHAGVPIAPLLGGAAVLGLAISFGAQNLVSDFFYGFMILLENQYKLNDVVRINDHSGQVERITLRMTALRDLEGNLHFIPNGQINSVVNMTHGWSRALFDLGVAYKEDVDRVMEVVVELGKELRQEPKFRPLILEDPTMLGVDEFADSAVMIKFFIKTRPLQQWAVKRELLRRIKKRFDELGIEIPFPHRTVYHRTDDVGLGRFSITAEARAGEGNGEGHSPGNRGG